MKMNIDSIQFESSREVINIINALEEFLAWRNRYDEDMIDDVRKLRDKLIIMEMNW